MPEIKLTATVDPSGKLVPDAPTVWLASLRELAGKRVRVAISTERKMKTTGQLAYWRGVIVPFFVDLWSQQRRYPNGLPPYDPEQVHEILVKHIIGYEEENGPLGEPVRKKTRNSDTAEMARLIDGARELAMHDYQSDLPAPGEQWDVVA